MPRYEVPKFMGYGDAIQANQTMSSAFKDLSNTSQNFLNYSENQKVENLPQILQLLILLGRLLFQQSM